MLQSTCKFVDQLKTEIYKNSTNIDETTVHTLYTHTAVMLYLLRNKLREGFTTVTDIVVMYQCQNSVFDTIIESYIIKLFPGL